MVSTFLAHPWATALWHDFLILLDRLFTLDLLRGFHLLAFSLPLELFGLFAFHEVEMQWSDLHKS